MANSTSIRKRRNAEVQQSENNVEDTSALQKKLPVARNRTSLHAAVNWTALLLVFMNASWLAYYYQAVRLPSPLSAMEAGSRGFSEQRAFRHVKSLTNFGPHPVGSNALDLAIEYVLMEVDKVAETSNPSVDVEFELFHAKTGVNRLNTGLFKGKSLVYTNLKHVIVRLVPKSSKSAEENCILVSSHIDSVVTSEGAGDCSSCVGVMLELLRALSQSEKILKHSIIFLFNTGEEEGLDGAHSFITQHPLNATVRAFIDLEAMGVGGKSYLFQAGPEKWLLQTFARVAKYPAGLVFAQDLFLSGLVKSATDFQVYKEVAGISGLDFAYVDASAVYHTKNDRLELVRPGSLQHLGDNVLVFLREVASTTELSNVKLRSDNASFMTDSVFFNILGGRMIVYSQQFAQLLNTSIILQSLVLLIGSLLQTKHTGLVSLALALLTLVLTWTLSIGIAVLASCILSTLMTSQFPFVSFTWLVIGLFGGPSLFGALLGHSIGHSILVKYLHSIQLTSLKKIGAESHNGTISHGVIWDAEKLLFKAGFLQWVFILALGTWYRVGVTYIALFWLVIPAAIYGLKELFLFPRQPPKEMETYILFLGLPLPIIISAETFMRFPSFIANTLVRFDKNPGETPLWVGNVVMAIAISVIICLSFVYLLPYVHRSGGVRWVLLGTALVTLMAFCTVYFGILPAYTKEASRLMNVAHVIETNSKCGVCGSDESWTPKCYVSISSFTPGKIAQEMEPLQKEGYKCGNSEGPDFVTFKVKHGCIKEVAMEDTIWRARPSFNVTRDFQLHGQRITSIVMQTGLARRWVLSVNTNKVQSLKLEIVSQHPETLILEGDIIGVDGWHIIQFASGKDGPADFSLNLFWFKNSTTSNLSKGKSDESLLLKLRTDLAVETAEVSTALQKLPDWCTLFGKSTSPYTLTYLANIWLAKDSGSLIF